MNEKEKLGDQLHQLLQLRETTTYLAKIAVILRNTPGNMLTFNQLMDTMEPLMSKDRKSENNVRICLSTHKCFVKIPIVLESRRCKGNYWKLDCSQITTKMVRRHFKGILQLFPELASKVEAENLSRASEGSSAVRSPEPAACRDVQIRCEVKFSSPFSIESLLKRDGPSAQASRASPLSSVQVRVEQQPLSTHRRAGTKRSISWDSEELLLQTSAASFPICSAGGSTHHGPTASQYAKPFKKRPVCTESSYPVYTGASHDPYFTGPSNSYITYSVPAFTHDGLRF
ncbi:forkhead box protein H1-like [Mugil cephalus]|uniref:forkhead box protein H1-like n=1 Tax=Mugil cephalus TaxID=48193 RepID=UPI001FB5A995|nr:forkhead box protein H1-like [Mugil cephalus]